MTVLVKRKRPKWKNIFYVRAYIVSCQGFNEKQLAAALGVSVAAVRKWKEQDKEFKEAIRMGLERFSDVESGKSEANSFRSYIFARLPGRLRVLWKKIMRMEKEKNGVQRIDAMLESRGKYARMHLFLYALTARSFNVSKACKAVHISYQEFRRWVTHEAGFAEMMDEIHYHKQNFFEEALIKLVRKGDTHAVIFANKTINKDRGYADKSTVDVNVQGNITQTINHNLVNLEELDLPIETLRQIRDAIRKKEEIRRIAEETPVGALEYINRKVKDQAEDVEFEVKEQEDD
jgi:hypothetical protein